MRNLKCLAAGALRTAANLLDPEPPDMKVCLHLLGWDYDGSYWTYSPAVSGTAINAGATRTEGIVTWHWPEGNR